MIRLRQILVTQYIGAIVIGYLAAQALIAIANIAMLPLRWYLEGRNPATQSVLFNEKPHPIPFPWESTLSGVTTVLLYFVIAYGLMRWLYYSKKDRSEQDTAIESGAL
jgi:hypothetical protein